MKINKLLIFLFLATFSTSTHTGITDTLLNNLTTHPYKTAGKAILSCMLIHLSASALYLAREFYYAKTDEEIIQILNQYVALENQDTNIKEVKQKPQMARTIFIITYGTLVSLCATGSIKLFYNILLNKQNS